MKIFIIILLFPLPGLCTNYIWPNTNGNILINRTNYPLLTAGDTVFIPVKSGGYRSFTFTNINSGTRSWDICIYWQSGAFITPNTSSPIFANSFDSVYGVKVYGMVMSDNIDVAFTSYSNGHYSQYVQFDSCIFRGMNGMFPSSPQTLTTPNFTGDTSNCFYMIRFSRCSWDSLVGGNSGNSALRIGGINKNQTWIHVEIDHCQFGDYSSLLNPGSYIAAFNTYGLYIHHDSLWNLGKSVASPVGHTQSILTQLCYFEIYNCWFGPLNFGNCIRNLGAGDIPSMAAIFSQWSVGYNGRSRVYNCVDSGSRKYPFMETRTDPGDTAALSPYIRMRTNPEVWFITGKYLGIGICCSPYVNSIVDCYSNDTLFVKGSYAVGPIDTIWNICNAGATHEGCNLFVHAGNGAITTYDSAFNCFTEFSKNTGIDSTTLRPVPGGFIYNRVTSYPSYITTDYYDVARNGPQPSGAIKSLPTAIGPITRGQRIHVF